MIELLFYLVVSLLLNFSLFVVAFKLQSDKLTDASYAISFMTLVISAAFISGFSWYVVIGVFIVSLWALRIGGFLVYRVVKIGKDARFDSFRSSFFGFMRFWLLQGVTAWVLLIPLFFAFRQEEPNISLLSAFGVIVLITGLAIESIADFQKWRFTSDERNKNKWIESGIWRYSRHPNYFGEILVWLGVFFYALPLLSLGEVLISLASPLLIITLLLFVTGIPLLEKAADERWGSLKAYQDYKKRTSILIPLSHK